ncbi:MAG: LysR family transcriptional regulator [Gammaproteobacteria bacterium]|nr:LysR family transcriptional regulator [Gammaproteobacteria bacterium]
MNWDDLRIFLAVARTGSISGAARSLRVQHSTISRRMRKMEAKLGARLVERKKTGYELTAAGENVRQAAIRIETEVLGVDGAVLGKDSSLVGPLRVSAINNMASSVLMPIFSSFSRANPRVDLHILVSNTDMSLAQREADVAIRLTNSPTDTLIGKRMVTVASTIYGSREYVARLRRGQQEPRWLGVECCEFHKSWTRHACVAPTHNFHSDDTLVTLAALREGLGVSFLPCFMGDADPELERYREPDPSHNLGLWILLHPDLRRTGRVLAFRDHVSESINDLKDLFEGITAQRDRG